jgi:hypothetical protein
MDHLIIIMIIIIINSFCKGLLNENHENFDHKTFLL